MLDLCVDAADAFIGVVSVEPNELMSSSARVYEVGRRRIQVAHPAQAALALGTCLLCAKQLTRCRVRAASVCYIAFEAVQVVVGVSG